MVEEKTSKKNKKVTKPVVKATEKKKKKPIKIVEEDEDESEKDSDSDDDLAGWTD